MGSRLVFGAFLGVLLIVFGNAQFDVPEGGGGGGRQNASRPTNPNPSLNPATQLVDAQGAPVNCNCQATQEYNPVCGSNGATYNNPSKLRCAQRCGYPVQLNFYGQCPAPRT